jgi:hypothetical protein
MDILLTNKGKPCFKYNGYLYRLTRISKYAKFYRCTKKDCKANCKTDLADQNILDGRFYHNHGVPEDRTFHRHKVKQSCKLKATENPTERPPNISPSQRPPNISPSQHEMASIIQNQMAKNEPAEFLPEDPQSCRPPVCKRRWRTRYDLIGIAFSLLFR